MEKRYDIIVTTDDFTSVEIEEITTKEKIKQRLTDVAPNCKIDWDKVFTDGRCKYFQHYMPANVTTTQNSYRQNSELHKNGNTVKVYISERWHEKKQAVTVNGK